MELLLIALTGYLLGSVPFAYVVGRVFYRTDVRQHGSGNLGGSNTGRVLGAKAGLAVMTLDLLKCTLAVYLAMRISPHPWAAAVGGLSSGLGHCYPVFARFRGGKAVATLYGYLFGLWVVAGLSPAVFFLPLAVFLGVLKLTKIVSLASMLSALAEAGFLFLTGADHALTIAAALFALLVIVRHHGNIRRIAAGTENRIRWM